MGILACFAPYQRELNILGCDQDQIRRFEENWCVQIVWDENNRLCVSDRIYNAPVLIIDSSEQMHKNDRLLYLCIDLSAGLKDLRESFDDVLEVFKAEDSRSDIVRIGANFTFEDAAQLLNERYDRKLTHREIAKAQNPSLDSTELNVAEHKVAERIKSIERLIDPTGTILSKMKIFSS